MMNAPSMLEVMQLLVVQLAAFQAVLLLASGLHKLTRRGRTQSVIHDFAGVPRYLAPAAGVVVAVTEMLAGLLLWTPSSRALGGVLAALIWGGYLALILRAIAQGRRDVDCGCTFGATQRPLGVFQVMRNGVLVCAALLVAAGSAASVTGPVIASQILAAFALLALYGALDQVMALTPLRRGELS
jgi:Methylamine utilisation protein MauE